MLHRLHRYILYSFFILIFCHTSGCESISNSGKTKAEYTVMVYAAGDNSLSWSMIEDLEEMEAVGSDQSMNVVLQTEYSPTTIGQNNNCDGAECFNRPNFNTFRYHVQKATPGETVGPDGPVEDIGNRDMTSPDELSEFIQWSKNNHPAENYVLVLANHGGAYAGIFEDKTSAGNNLMDLDELRYGLQQSNTDFDVIAFEACLMGGAETLYTLRDLTDYVVFSEKNVLSDGLPYTPILTTIQNNPSITPRKVSKTFVDRYIAYYENGSGSVTMSAADMSVFDSFLDAWNNFSAILANNLSDLSADLSNIIPQVTQFERSVLRDLGHFLLLMNNQTKNDVLHSVIGELQAELSGLIMEHQSYTSSNFGAIDVRNSQGLSIVLPFGGPENNFLTGGYYSFDHYRELYPSLPWTGFLEKWVRGSGGISVIDQQSDSFQMTLFWGGEEQNSQTDFDLWVLEPNGNLFIPYLGSLTPSGTFSPSSQQSDLAYESYYTRQFVEEGTYYFFSALWADPGNTDPEYQIKYRFSDDNKFGDLYNERPTLNDDNSWYNDSSPTLEEAANGKYSDLKLTASWQAGSQELIAHQNSSSPKVASQSRQLLTRKQRQWLQQASKNNTVKKALRKMRDNK